MPADTEIPGPDGRFNGGTYGTARDLTRHLDTYCAGKKEKFTCGGCGKQFTRKDNMQKHERGPCPKLRGTHSF